MKQFFVLFFFFVASHSFANPLDHQNCIEDITSISHNGATFYHTKEKPFIYHNGIKLYCCLQCQRANIPSGIHAGVACDGTHQYLACPVSLTQYLFLPLSDDPIEGEHH